MSGEEHVLSGNADEVPAADDGVPGESNRLSASCDTVLQHSNAWSWDSNGMPGFDDEVPAGRHAVP